jgi:pre-mRNA cleavage complex 2 protein Pcf11
MDWHFRVHHRIAEAEKRGQHRSWYVDAADWVGSREAVDTDYVAPEGGGSAVDDATGGGGGGGSGAAGSNRGGSGGKGAKKMPSIPVPEDPKVNTVCPICQEKFEMKWLDEAQEWVWVDAIRVGGEKVYHASCYGEATKGAAPPVAVGGRSAGNDRGTPEPTVLGTRKAEVSLFFYS